MKDVQKTPLTDDLLIKAAKSTLDESTTLLDDDVHQRLQQARRAAVQVATSAAQRPTKTVFRPSFAMAAGGFAVLTLVVSVVFYQYRPELDTAAMASIEDVPILTAPEELELYEELDFYQWLAEEHDGVG